MTLTINGTTMTSDHTAPLARQAPGRNAGKSPGCPARPWTATPPSPR